MTLDQEDQMIILLIAFAGATIVNAGCGPGQVEKDTRKFQGFLMEEMEMEE